MKKRFIFMFVAFAIGTVAFTKDYSINIDFAVGFPLGFSNLTQKAEPNDLNIKYNELGFGMKVQTYSCFLLKGMLGIYASAGFGIGFGLQTEKLEEVLLDDGGFEKTGDFLIGPAFGVDIEKFRIQTGIAFHAVLSRMNSFLFEGNHKGYHAFGFALTPQVRFTADKRCSFVVGVDLIFDFPKTISNTDSYGDKKEIKYKNCFRFGCTPYLGLGINFGR